MIATNRVVDLLSKMSVSLPTLGDTTGTGLTRSGSEIFDNKKEYGAFNFKKHFSSKSSSASQQKPDSRGKYSCDEEAGDKDDYKVPEQMEAARDRDSEYSVFPLLDEELESVFSRA